MQYSMNRVLMVIVLFSNFFIYSCRFISNEDQSIVLQGVTNPHEIISDENHLIISDGTEGTNILVFDRKNFSLVSKYGGNGDTDGKFIVSGGHKVDIDIIADTLLITSHWKVSRITKQGNFLYQDPIDYDTYNYQKFGNGYIGMGSVEQNGKYSFTFNLYNQDFGFVKTITSVKSSNQGDDGIFFFSNMYQGITYKSNYYFKGKNEEFEIEIFNKNGNKEKKVHLPYDRILVTEDHKNAVLKAYKEHPLFSQFFDMIKKRVVFPDYLPAIYNMNICNDYIYVIPYLSNLDNSPLYKLDIEGNLVKQYNVPLKWKSTIEAFPFTIYGGYIYQLIENNEKKWELSIIKIK